MERFYARRFLSIAAHLAALAEYEESGSVLIASEFREKMLKEIDTIMEDCNVIGLDVALLHLAKMRKAVEEPNCTYAALAKFAHNVAERIIEQSSLNLFFFVNKKDAEFYVQPELFGSEVNEAFPDAIFDIEEAGKCFALDRYTACVYHLMKVMEVGLKAVSKELSIASYLPSWDAILTKINGELQTKRQQKSRQWRKREPFFSEAAAHLGTVKVAWRNPTMHVAKTYDRERAQDIFNSVKGFMRHLASGLKRRTKTKSV